MPIIGIGTDIVEIGRVGVALKSSFLKRFFTDAENELFVSRGMKPQTIAAGFAAKEAFVKALGTGFSGVSPEEVEVLRDEDGRPVINVYGRARELFDGLGASKIHVSLSHEKGYAVAFVVIE